jgi:dTMP kinase
MLNLMPDITFFIDVESTKALQRALSRNDVNKFEAKNLEFHRQVSQGFQQLAERYSSRIARIDADGLDPQEVHHKVIQLLSL